MTGGDHISGRSEPRDDGPPAECDVRVWGADDGKGGLILECEPAAGAMHWRIRVDGGKRLPFLTEVITQHTAAHAGDPK